MKHRIAGAFLIAGLILSVSAFFAISKIHPRLRQSELKPPAEKISKALFGMTIHHYPATPWPSIPFASRRTWDTWVNWPDIQTAPNTFVWSNLDAMIELAERHGVDLLFTLGRTPRWASAAPDIKSAYGPGQCAPPSKLQYWDDFLRAVVSHVAGKIRFWETWNEPQSPDSVFYCGDISTMVELQRRAYEIIKKIEPNAKILTPSPQGGYGPPWMSRFLAAGGGKYADIMAFHGYLGPGAKPETINELISEYKAVFAKQGQERKPIWDTEAGWGEDQWLTDSDLQAAFLAKFYILHWSAGVERLYWYAYDNEKWGTLWDAKNRLHKAGIAYREVHRWLVNAIMQGPCVAEQAVWRCNLMRQSGYKAIILWTADGSSIRIPVTGYFRQFRDLDGEVHPLIDNNVVVSTKPILVETGSVF